jgi:hypothetical protein
MDFITIAQLVLSVMALLVGFPSLLATVLTALEYFKVIDIAGADKISFVANALLFVGLFVLAVMGKLDLVNVLDAEAGQFAKILIQVLLLLGVPVGFSLTTHHYDNMRQANFLHL